ncbi:hypothetical protein HZR84_12200 [Hyphobacterium sp. CCMP332]|nr:hypothetical protein HZR84_12200 [Hyphobacterium sp. CCMP332]
MNLQEFIKMVLKHVKTIVLSAMLLSTFTFWFTNGQKKEYVSHTLLNTGLVSGYNIESEQGSRVDHAYTNNEIENLINLASSTETLIELSLRLIGKSIIDQEMGRLLVLDANRDELTELIESFSIRQELKKDSIELYHELKRQFEKNKESIVYEVLHSKHRLFGLESLEEISISREGNSDMIKMEYKTIDPYFCEQTLSFLTRIFLRKHKAIKEGQTESVLAFFDRATKQTAAKLKDAENELLNFSVKNQIINYYEQTRFISGNKQELDKKYQEEIKILNAADSAVAILEKNLDNQSLLALIQEELFQKRRELSSISSELAFIELSETNNSQDAIWRKSELERKKIGIESEINSTATNILDINTSKEGLHTKDILTKWLNQNITKVESRAKIQAMKEMRKEYGQIYKRFAPLGSTLKRLEREIDVAEREYLENLHSYNQARLHKYNMLMSSNLKVIDPPFFPAVPEKSKRVLMLVLSLVAGAFIPLFIITALELTDSSLKNPKITKETTGLNVIGALPLIAKRKNKNIPYSRIVHMALNLFFQNVHSLKKANHQPVRIAFLSNYESEGKSFLLKKISEYASTNNLKYHVIQTTNSRRQGDSSQIHKEEKAYSNLQGLHDLDKYYNLKALEANDIIIYEIPAVLHHSFPISILRETDLNILVCNAARKWTEADKQALKLIKRNSRQRPHIMLNGLKPDQMETVIGEIPRNRSQFRKMVKSILINQSQTSIQIS